MITKKEAISKIKRKLYNRKIKCSLGDCWKTDITNENFIMEINSVYYSSFYSNKEINYDEVNIQISTIEYPHTRRRLNNFNVINGDYSILTEKTKFIIQEDIKKKKEENIKEQKGAINLAILKEKLKGLGAKKEQYSEGYIIKNKYFEISFYALANKILIDIEDNDNLSLDRAIELIKKLR